MPERLQLSRKGGWRLPWNAKSVARPGRWGNRYVVGHSYGYVGAERFPLPRAALLEDAQLIVADRALAVEWHRDWLLNSRRAAPLRAELHTLAGRDLYCWCPVDGGPCHAATLIELANDGWSA